MAVSQLPSGRRRARSRQTVQPRSDPAIPLPRIVNAVHAVVVTIPLRSASVPAPAPVGGIGSPVEYLDPHLQPGSVSHGAPTKIRADERRFPEHHVVCLGAVRPERRQLATTDLTDYSMRITQLDDGGLAGDATGLVAGEEQGCAPDVAEVTTSLTRSALPPRRGSRRCSPTTRHL